MFEEGKIYKLNNGTLLEFYEETETDYVFIEGMMNPWGGDKKGIEEMYKAGVLVKVEED